MAGGKGNTFSDDFLKLIFNGTTIANLAINATASPLTNLYVSLHTASPGAAGSQTTNEAAYGSYARQPVARSGAGWTVSGTSVVPFAAITFPTATGGGTETETYAAIGTDISGAGKLLWFGPITPNIAVSAGVQPQLSTSSMATES